MSAREAFLRASEYYRQAYFFIRSDLDSPALQEAYRGHVETFQGAAQLMETPVEHVRIPYDETSLSAYLFTPADDSSACPTILLPCGYDSTAEAGWTSVAPARSRAHEHH